MLSSSRARSPRWVDRYPSTWTRIDNAQKKETAKDRVEDQKAVDKALLATIKKEAHLTDYLRSTFTLRHSDRPHAMVF